MSNPTPPTASSNASIALGSILERNNDLVRAAMQKLLQSAPGLEPFYGMMEYHLGWVDRDFAPRASRAGKNLRPNLCLLIGEGLGATPDDLAMIAAGLELLHNFSLIHDDIQDRSTTRRGRPTVWTIWGEAQAINAGDGLFSLAHLAWFHSGLAERDLAAFAALVCSAEATVLALCEGQYLDMKNERNLDVTAEAYLQMIGRKTAGLIGESAWAGARAAGAAPAVLDATRALGRDLGIAFQIRDDILGIWGDEEVTGKSASSDIATRKMTLPVILTLQSGPEHVRRELRDRYETPTGGDEQQIRDLLTAADAYRLAQIREEQHWDAAMRSLAALPLSPEWLQHMQEFAQLFVGRKA